MEFHKRSLSEINLRKNRGPVLFMDYSMNFWTTKKVFSDFNFPIFSNFSLCKKKLAITINFLQFIWTRLPQKISGFWDTFRPKLFAILHACGFTKSKLNFLPPIIIIQLYIKILYIIFPLWHPRVNNMNNLAW